MKRIFFFVTVVLLYSATHAQHVQFGLKAGVNVATISNLDDNDAIVAIHGGGLAHIHISDHFAIQPELLLSAQGTRFNRSGTPDMRWHLGYVNIPVLFQFMTGEGLRLQTGPQFGLLPIATARVDGSRSGNIKEDFKSGDFGWAFGIGYILPSNWGLDARYNVGISDIYNGGRNQRNGVFQLGLFYQFGK